MKIQTIITEELTMIKKIVNNASVFGELLMVEYPGGKNS